MKKIISEHFKVLMLLAMLVCAVPVSSQNRVRYVLQKELDWNGNYQRDGNGQELWIQFTNDGLYSYVSKTAREKMGEWKYVGQQGGRLVYGYVSIDIGWGAQVRNTVTDTWNYVFSSDYGILNVYHAPMGNAIPGSISVYKQENTKQPGFYN